MKKTVLVISLLLSIITASSAQFLYALGIAGGLSYSKHGWSKEPPYFQEQYLWGFNGAILAEFFQNDNYKWRAEIMYNQLGTKEVSQNNGIKYINRTSFISLNNYWVVRYPVAAIIPYFLIGPRVEYLMTRSPQQFDNIIDAFYSFHVSAAAGVGLEPAWKSRFRPFIEVFYNHDLMPSYIGAGAPGNAGTTVIFQHDWEFRIGIKYIFPEYRCPPIDNKADGAYPNNPP